MSIFGERLVTLMIENGLTQKELAKKANVTESAMSYYAKGQRTPSGDVLLRLAKSLNTSTDFLLGNTSVPTGPDNEKIQYLQRNLGKLDEAQLQKAENVLKTVFDDIWDDEGDE